MEGAYVFDGAGFDLLIGGLPLKTGYSLALQMPDMMTAKAKTVVLSVTGNEAVNDVECVKVEITATDNPNDKTTLWIHPELKVAEKIEQIIPAIGNVKMTITLKVRCNIEPDGCQAQYVLRFLQIINYSYV